MSVPKDSRVTGELAINVAARLICTHILKITSNQNKFPADQWHYVQLIRDTAIDIDLKCWKANNIYVGENMALYEKRLSLEAEAGDQCTTMLELINIAKPLFHMSSKRYKYLTDQYVGLRKQIRNWYRSDRERLKPTTGM